MPFSSFKYVQRKLIPPTYGIHGNNTSACWLNRAHSGVHDIGLRSPPECLGFSEQKSEQDVFIVFSELWSGQQSHNHIG